MTLTSVTLLSSKTFNTRQDCLQAFYDGQVFITDDVFIRHEDLNDTCSIRFAIGHLEFQHEFDRAYVGTTIISSGQTGTEDIVPSHKVFEVHQPMLRSHTRFDAFIHQVSLVLDSVLGLTWTEYKGRLDEPTQCESLVYKAWLEGQSVYDGAKLACTYNETAYDIIPRIEAMEKQDERPYRED